jgi:hypothetical protein
MARTIARTPCSVETIIGFGFEAGLASETM